ncbi:phospholipase [Pseudomonas sp. P1.8]|jgi:1-phosphatidylinositol phosphodiesterase|uniref:phospholipase n=1 Tax=Pseudomonas sp. P1.8 TaxID=1699310 RepID=UPI00069D78B8|nr:phospholipase [Pseudomonas sp. P1.8]
MADNEIRQFDNSAWMSSVPGIDNLKLIDIVWPGAHNAGMDKKAPNHDAAVGIWTNCQNDSFSWQLVNGARAFDIRLGYAANRKQPFYFHHNGFRSPRELNELIDAVIMFLARNPDEFIVLDFHQLGDGAKDFDYKALSELLVHRLGPRVLRRSDAAKTLGEIKRSSTLRRIIMAALVQPEMDIDYFWPPIPHKWHKSTFSSVAEVRRLVAKTVEEAPYRTPFLWSLSVTSYSVIGPVRIPSVIDNWFSRTQDVTSRCSIINTDFFDESDIVRHCADATRIKAARDDD